MVMTKKILVFKREVKYFEESSISDIEYDLKIWKPSLTNIIPPNKDLKYVSYWLFHFFRIFKNRNYSAYLLYHQDNLVSSFLIVPAYFKWAFMKEKDVQFTYVMTTNNYKGMGIAGKLILKAISDLKKNVDVFWYVTDSANLASIKVAEKIGFKYENSAERTKYLKILKLRGRGLDSRL